MFFSKETKRVDLALTSEHHTEKNAESKEANAKSEMFTNLLERDSHTMDSFKESVSYYDDTVKKYWASA